MKNTTDPDEVVRAKVVPAAEELVAALAERVGPLAKEAVEAVTPYAQQLSDAVSPYAQQLSDAVSPYAQQLSDAVSPYAHQAAGAVSPYAAHVGGLGHQAADKVAPYAQQAAVAVAPYAALVREQSLRSGHDLAERLEPALEAAKDAFSGARDKVTHEYVPAVGAAAATAAASAAASASPLVGAAADRGRSLVKGARNEPVVVTPPPKKKRGWLTTLAVVAAAAGATYVVVRRLVGDKGSQWQTARPTTPYSPPVSAEAGVAEPQPSGAAAGTGPTDVVASTTSLYGTVGSDGGASGPVDDTDSDAISANNTRTDDVADVDESIDVEAAPSAGTDSGSTGDAPTDGAGAGAGGEDAEAPYSDEKIEQELETVEERAYEEPSDAVWAEQDTKMGGGPDAHPERYDMAGAYVGVEPPEGYTIKGNERSMKYHLPDSNSYGRTLAQVWFATEEAAQEAGFTRAQH